MPSREQYDELEKAVILEDKEPRKRRSARLKRLPSYFFRVPLSVVVEPSRPCPFDAKGRLYLILLFRTHFGQREVRVTTALAREAGIDDRRMKAMHLKHLEQDGWIRVERKRGAPLSSDLWRCSDDPNLCMNMHTLWTRTCTGTCA